MNSVQENRMSMFYAVETANEKHSAVWMGVLAFANTFSEFKANMVSINGALARQVIDIRGYAIEKAEFADVMIDMTMKVSGATLAFATVRGDAVLAKKMMVAPSTLRKYRDAIVQQACQALLDNANVEVLNLADYGLLPADMTALQDAIDAYSALISAPRSAIAERKGQTAEIAMLVKDTSKLLNNRMDALMGLFLESAPEFHREYFDARIIIDRKAGTSEEEGSEAVAA